MMVSSSLRCSAATDASRAANLSHVSVQKRTIVHVSASLKRGFFVGTGPVIFILMSLGPVNPIRVVSLNPCTCQMRSSARIIHETLRSSVGVVPGFSHTWTPSIALQQHRARCHSDTTVGPVWDVHGRNFVWCTVKGVVEERVLALGDALNRRAPEDDNFRWSHIGLELVVTFEA